MVRRLATSSVLSGIPAICRPSRVKTRISDASCPCVTEAPIDDPEDDTAEAAVKLRDPSDAKANPVADPATLTPRSRRVSPATEDLNTPISRYFAISAPVSQLVWATSLGCTAKL